MGLDTNLIFFRFAHKIKFTRPDTICHSECFAEERSKMYRGVDLTPFVTPSVWKDECHIECSDEVRIGMYRDARRDLTSFVWFIFQDFLKKLACPI